MSEKMDLPFLDPYLYNARLYSHCLLLAYPLLEFRIAAHELIRSLFAPFDEDHWIRLMCTGHVFAHSRQQC